MSNSKLKDVTTQAILHSLGVTIKTNKYSNLTNETLRKHVKHIINKSSKLSANDRRIMMLEYEQRVKLGEIDRVINNEI